MQEGSELSLAAKKVRNKGLAYTEQFRSLVSSEPKVFQRFLSLMREVRNKKVGTVSENGGLSVRFAGAELIGHNFGPDNSLGTTRQVTEFFDVSFAGQRFFVKKVAAETEEVRAYEEINSAEEASKKLKGIRGVSVNKFHFAFSNDNYSYYVSEWSDLPKMVNYLNTLQFDKSVEESQKFEIRLNEIRKHLKGFDLGEINSNNCFYDKLTDTIVLFDLYKK